MLLPFTARGTLGGSIDLVIEGKAKKMSVRHFELQGLGRGGAREWGDGKGYWAQALRS